MEYCSAFIGWAVGSFVFGIIVLLGAIVTAIVLYANREDVDYVINKIILVLIGGVFFFCVLFPTNIEQCTEVVTIDHFENRSPLGIGKETHVAFVVNGEENCVKIENGQKEMYELIIGKDVELTYGKVNTLIWNPFADDGEWMFGNIKLAEEKK